jgi:hypothetical protein
LAAAALLAGYTLWRFLRRSDWLSALLAGASLGLLQNTKFTALIFVPLFGILLLLGAWQRYRADTKIPVRFILLALTVYPVTAFITLWATNGFQSGPLIEPLPLLGQLQGWAIPLSNHLDQLVDIGSRLQVRTPAFLLGQHSDEGWWYYFPVAFLLKTPLPTLILLTWAIIRVVRRGALISRLDLAALLIPPIGYFIIALTSDINLGYRHLLPMLPFLYVFTGFTVGNSIPKPVGEKAGHLSRRSGALITSLLAWLVVASIWIHPHFLAFFNGFAGGPNNGWRSLVDSNLDWGQDLGNLKRWLDNQAIDQVWLSYFGEARPEYYGIDYRGLDSFPPRLMNPAARPFYPPDPAPGLYAISATNLQGVHFADRDQFAFFRRQKPLAKIGYSIFLFDQPAYGHAVDLLLGNVQVDELRLDDYARLQTNDVTLRWFDADQALLLTENDKPVWLAISPEVPLNPVLASYVDRVSTDSIENDHYQLFEVRPRFPAFQNKSVSLSQGEHQITFLGSMPILSEKDEIQVITAWRQEGEPVPVKLFVHLLDDSGEIVNQWDGIGAAWEGWREGDTLLQVHELSLPPPLSAGTYRLVAGLYHPDTIQRWRTDSGTDTIELGKLTQP